LEIHITIYGSLLCNKFKIVTYFIYLKETASGIPNRPGGGAPPLPGGRPGGALPPPMLPS